MSENRNAAPTGIVSYRIAAGCLHLFSCLEAGALFPTQAVGLLQSLVTLIIIRMQIDIGRSDRLMAQSVTDDT